MTPEGVSIRDHFEAQLRAQREFFAAEINALRERVTAAMAAADRATSKAEAAANVRFEGVNEFRGALEDYQRVLPTRTEVDATFAGVRKEVNATFAGHESRIAALEKKQERRDGKGEGIEASWAMVIGAAALISTLVGLAFRFIGP